MMAVSLTFGENATFTSPLLYINLENRGQGLELNSDNGTDNIFWANQTGSGACY